MAAAMQVRSASTVCCAEVALQQALSFIMMCVQVVQVPQQYSRAANARRVLRYVLVALIAINVASAFVSASRLLQQQYQNRQEHLVALVAAITAAALLVYTGTRLMRTKLQLIAASLYASAGISVLCFRSTPLLCKVGAICSALAAAVASRCTH